jgi:hypothetical protein
MRTAVTPLGNLGPISNVATDKSFQLDSDGDGIPDQWEYTYGLNPTNAADALLDSDGDGLSNIEEYMHGTSPILWDTDGDSMGDGWELANGLEPLNPADGSENANHDGLTNLQKYQLGLDPLVPARPWVAPVAVTTNGGFVLSVDGLYGRGATLQFSTNLSDWDVLTNLPAVNARTLVEDVSATNSQHRFYRVVVP